MAIRVPGIMQAKQILHQSKVFANQATAASSVKVPKGHIAVYVGGEPKEEIRYSGIILEPAFISRIAEKGRGRIRISSSNRSSHNSLQGRHLHQPHF